MKTIKQIADTLGIDKQKVYRYIKKYNINEARQDGSKLLYDEVIEAQIRQYFSEEPVSSEAHQNTSEVHQSASSDTVISEVIAMLKDELAAKNKLIDEQQQTIRMLSESINAANKNELAETIIDGHAKLSPPKPPLEKVSLWNRIFKRK